MTPCYEPYAVGDVSSLLHAPAWVFHVPWKASLILFLEAKTDVTNISGSDSSSFTWWQRWVKRFALFYSYVYQ